MIWKQITGMYAFLGSMNKIHARELSRKNTFPGANKSKTSVNLSE
jgi:hypothetical protein